MLLNNWKAILSSTILTATFLAGFWFLFLWDPALENYRSSKKTDIYQKALKKLKEDHPEYVKAIKGNPQAIEIPGDDFVCVSFYKNEIFFYNLDIPIYCFDREGKNLVYEL